MVTIAAKAIAVEFEKIDLPETINFGDTGSVTLNLTNTSEFDLAGSVELNLFISTDDDRDSESDQRNDGLLDNRMINLDLAAGESTTVEIDYENLSSVVAPGAYHLLAGIQGGELTSELVSATGSDAVLTWHATALNAIQEFGETDHNITNIGIEPTVGSRGLAIVQTSVFNAVNAFEGKFESYLDLQLDAPAEDASIDAAVAGAAITGIAHVFPGTQDLSDSLIAQLKESLGLSSDQVVSLLSASGLERLLGESIPGRIPSYPAPFISNIPGIPEASAVDIPVGISDEIWNGFRVGVQAADQVIKTRADDGFSGFFSGPDNPASYGSDGEFENYIWTPEFQFHTATGESIFGNVPYARSPGWGEVRTFSGVTVEDFLNNANIDANGDGSFLDGRPFANAIDPVVTRFQQNLYATEIEQVRLLGGLQDTDLTDITRSQDQTEIALFWAYDRTDTFRPFGQLHQIAEEAAFRADGELIDSARTLALTSIALADAAITAWTQKYAEVQPRPQDVISGDGQGLAIAAIDGLDQTVADPFWQPLLADPPFPDYFSGHSTFGGAFGGVLHTLFPKATDIPVVSQDVIPGNGIFGTSNDELFDVANFSPVRLFESYAEIGAEDAISRVYGGVHVLESTQDAVTVGADIGAFVATHLLAPVL